jgi:hypothetical protein
MSAMARIFLDHVYEHLTQPNRFTFRLPVDRVEIRLHDGLEVSLLFHLRRATLVGR